jgi:cell division protein FtsZ
VDGDVLCLGCLGVRGVIELSQPSNLIGVDLGAIRTVSAKMGRAGIGSREAAGENRAILAAELAITDALLGEIGLSDAARY